MTRLALLIIILAAAQQAGSEEAIALTKIEQDLAKVHVELRNPKIFNRKTCATYIENHTLSLFEDGANRYLPDTEEDQTKLLNSAPRIARSLFEFRIGLLEISRKFDKTNDLNQSCRNSIFRALRYSRFIEEMLMEWYFNKTGTAAATEVLAGKEPSLMVRGNEKVYTPHSGDILVVRSRFFVSATIARISDEEGQFSHSALIHIDDNNQVWVLESLIEKGVIAVPWREWVRHEPVRVLVLRHHDGNSAKQVANWLFNFIEWRKKNGLEPVPYDFNMNFQDSRELSCSELVRFAFAEATDGRIGIPKYPSSVNKLSNKKLFKDLGIKELEIFSPSDYETDPSLTLIAEWKDYTRTYGTRIQDAILTSVFSWMTQMNYELTYKGFTQGMGELYWRFLRPMGLGQQMVPTNMTRGFFNTILALNSVTGALETAMRRVENQNRWNKGWGLDYKTMLVNLEEIRKSDCKEYLSRRNGMSENYFLGEPDLSKKELLFHQFLNIPSEAGDCQENQINNPES